MGSLSRHVYWLRCALTGSPLVLMLPFLGSCHAHIRGAIISQRTPRQRTHYVRKRRWEKPSRIRTQPEVFSSRDTPVFQSKVIFPQLLSPLSPQINISAPCLTKQAFYRENDLKSKRIGTRHLALMVIITRLLWRTKNRAHLFTGCYGNSYFSNLISSLSRFFCQVCSDLAK